MIAAHGLNRDGVCVHSEESSQTRLRLFPINQVLKTSEGHSEGSRDHFAVTPLGYP